MKKRNLKLSNTTKYGEFVCSSFAWLPLDKQKEKAEKFENLTQNNNSEK